MIIQIVLARLLFPEAFGIMAILLVVTNIADAVSQSGLGAALIQRSDESVEAYSTAYWLSAGIALIMYVIIFLGAPVIAAFYGITDLTLYLRVLSVVVFVNSLNSIQRSYLQNAMDFKSIFKVNTCAVILSGAIGIVSAFLGANVWALVIQAILQALITFLILLVVVPIRPSFQFDRLNAKQLFSYGWKICTTSVLNIVFNGVSELVIGKTCKMSDLGFYSQGRKYPNAFMGILVNALSNVLFPALSHKKDDGEAFVDLIKKALYAGNFIMMPVSLFLCVSSEPIVILLLTEKWVACVPVFQLALLTNAFVIFEIVNLRAYMALGNSGLYLNINIVKTVVGGIAICVTAIITHDIYATALAACMVAVIGIFFVDMPPAKKQFGYGALRQVRDQLPTLLMAFMACVPAFFCADLISNSLMTLLIQLLVYWSIYSAMALLLKPKAFVMFRDILRDLLKQAN